MPLALFLFYLDNRRAMTTDFLHPSFARRFSTTATTLSTSVLATRSFVNGYAVPPSPRITHPACIRSEPWPACFRNGRLMMKRRLIASIILQSQRAEARVHRRRNARPRRARSLARERAPWLLVNLHRPVNGFTKIDLGGGCNDTRPSMVHLWHCNRRRFDRSWVDTISFTAYPGTLEVMRNVNLFREAAHQCLIFTAQDPIDSAALLRVEVRQSSMKVWVARENPCNGPTEG